jgi:hypothetical protein
MKVDDSIDEKNETAFGAATERILRGIPVTRGIAPGGSPPKQCQDEQVTASIQK